MYNTILAMLFAVFATLCSSHIMASETNDNTLCVGHEDWTRKAAISSYFRGHYYEFDVYAGAFISAPGRSDSILAKPLEERIRVGNMWHDRLLGIIQRLGLMLPRSSHPGDLQQLIHQVQTADIHQAKNTSHVAFLRQSLLLDMLASGDAASETIVDFLTRLMTLEAQAAAMKNGEFSLHQLHTFYQTLDQAEVSRKAFRGVLKQVIFDDDLHPRMSKRLAEFCSIATTL